jgi:hypothetical protein
MTEELEVSYGDNDGFDFADIIFHFPNSDDFVVMM